MLISYDSSYGSVFKAMHKESGQVVAIKQVPVDTDLQEIIKEISMMQQCDRYQIEHYFTVFDCVNFYYYPQVLLIVLTVQWPKPYTHKWFIIHFPSSVAQF